MQGINVAVTGNKWTIVTLDLQLYAKCLQLRADKEIYDNYVFRLGELHAVFAMLKVLGKYIEYSGIDSLFLESGIYGETTLKQIMQGKHMKRGVEAHTVMYLALTKVCFNEWLHNGSDVRVDDIKLLLNEIPSAKYHDSAAYKVFHHQVQEELETSNIFSNLDSFRSSLKNQGMFYNNYMKMVESLLLFIRSSREKLWNLHLASLDEFTKYFFAHDQINYARLSPVYVASMLELQQTDYSTWEYLEQNFSVNKSGIPFTSMGSDHALEQDNKLMKVTGGIVGLTQKPSALNRFFLIAPVLNSISTKFQSMYGCDAAT